MILSRQQRFILLAPWKTASSTAHLRLEKYNESPYSRFYQYNPYLQRVVHQHITYSDYSALPESQLGYFVGAFVRNPYDRVYSGFIQLQRDILEQPTARFPASWIKELVLRQLADNLAQLVAGDFEFDRWFSLIEEFQVFETGRNSSFPLHPAHYWTGIDRQQQIDFVGRVESFEHDFAEFCQTVGIAQTGRENANVSDQPSEKQYRYIERMKSSSIDKINTLFDADFRLFGYEKIRL